MCGEITYMHIDVNDYLQTDDRTTSIFNRRKHGYHRKYS